MTVYTFTDPRVMHHRMRCGRCGDYVLVSVLDGAYLPREPHYRCSDCHETPEASEARVAALTVVQPELGAA